MIILRSLCKATDGQRRNGVPGAGVENNVELGNEQGSEAEIESGRYECVTLRRIMKCTKDAKMGQR